MARLRILMVPFVCVPMILTAGVTASDIAASRPTAGSDPWGVGPDPWNSGASRPKPGSDRWDVGADPWNIGSSRPKAGSDRWDVGPPVESTFDRLNLFATLTESEFGAAS